MFGFIAILLLLVIYVCKDLMILTGIILGTVVCGLVLFPVEFLGDKSCPGLILLVLFYPVTICLTFPRVMREVLCEGMSYLCGSMRDSYGGLFGRN